jgi:crotonobetainyl-CoA:carnitine CoA-transferase CaiB-like acyl-CoA transferase
VKGFGEGSPFEKNLAFDMIAQACGGTMSVTGEADGHAGEARHPSLGDTGTGMLMAITILGALYQRRETGQGGGCRWRCRTRCCTTCAPISPPSGAPARRWGAPAGKVPGITNAPSGLYPCKPGGPNDYVYVMTSRGNPEHWSRLMKADGTRGADQ